MEHRRQSRKPVNVVAELTFKNKVDNVVCGDLTKSGCMIRLNYPINPLSHVSLRLYGTQNSEGEMQIFQPISSTVRWYRPSKNNPKIFFAGIQFNHDLNINHGVLQILNPERFKEVKKKKLSVSNNSLMGNYVDCFVCGQSDIPFYTLRSKVMQTRSNIFGVTAYSKPMPGKDFCDYNLLQITVCPNCFFASNDSQFFKAQTEDINPAPFDVGAFYKNWKDSIPQRKQLIDSNKDNFFTEHRSIKQSIVSYDLAIETYDLIAELSGLPGYHRKVVSFLMNKAELLTRINKREEAEKEIQKASMRLSDIFSNLEGIPIIRAAALLCMIKMYFKEYKDLGQYMGFLKMYDKDGKLDPASQESKVLRLSGEMVFKAYQDRELYSREKLKDFHLSS